MIDAGRILQKEAVAKGGSGGDYVYSADQAMQTAQTHALIAIARELVGIRDILREQQKEQRP